MSIEKLDKIEHNKIDSNRKSYHVKFQEITENMIYASGIDRIILALKPQIATKEELEKIDEEITHIMSCARK